MEVKVPNWKAIETSEIWKQEIKPWFDGVYETEMEQMALEISELSKTNQSISNEFMVRWGARIEVLKMLRDMPGEMNEVNRILASQEREDDARRRESDARSRSRF